VPDGLKIKNMYKTTFRRGLPALEPPRLRGCHCGLTWVTDVPAILKGIFVGLAELAEEGLRVLDLAKVGGEADGVDKKASLALERDDVPVVSVGVRWVWRAERQVHETASDVHVWHGATHKTAGHTEAVAGEFEESGANARVAHPDGAHGDGASREPLTLDEERKMALRHLVERGMRPAHLIVDGQCESAHTLWYSWALGCKRLHTLKNLS
jgi:hypothetical protein